MGTPEFAVASLDALIKNGFNVVGVVTAPDKPSGRGMKMNVSAVKKYAIGKGVKILQPEKLKNADFLQELKSLDADLQVVVAFRMLPEVVWNKPPLGTINLHASLLPQYRGAAPINWVIINGEKETGVTTFKLQQEIDTGNILLQEK
ncbi:MAG TPA: methionyl-tRNA formyltransferase, partial [Chitinophagaceae bacterium]